MDTAPGAAPAAPPSSPSGAPASGSTRSEASTDETAREDGQQPEQHVASSPSAVRGAVGDVGGVGSVGLVHRLRGGGAPMRARSTTTLCAFARMVSGAVRRAASGRRGLVLAGPHAGVASGRR